MIEDLSAQEERILNRLADGLTNRQIASELCVEPHTIRNYCSMLYPKIGVKDRAAAAAWMLDRRAACR